MKKGSERRKGVRGKRMCQKLDDERNDSGETGVKEPLRTTPWSAMRRAGGCGREKGGGGGWRKRWEERNKGKVRRRLRKGDDEQAREKREEEGRGEKVEKEPT